MADLLHDVRLLVTLPYPEPSSESTEAIARDAFLNAMLDGELSLKVREKEPKSLDETFRPAVRLETYKKSFRALDPQDMIRSEPRRQVRSTRQDDTIAELAAQFKNFMEVQRKDRESHEAWRKSIKDRLPPNLSLCTGQRRDGGDRDGSRPPERYKPGGKRPSQ